MTEKTVTITKRQYRAVCDALINTVNMGQQILAIGTDGSQHSETALYQAQQLRQVIEKQLKVAMQ